jgi:hypothetical protein
VKDSSTVAASPRKAEKYREKIVKSQGEDLEKTSEKLGCEKTGVRLKKDR